MEIEQKEDRDILRKRTKIVATLGPASESEKVLEEMILAGLNVARFNFSHGEHSWHTKTMRRVRHISERNNKSVAILADLQGPRIRTHVPENITIKKGDTVRLFDVSTDEMVIEDARKEGLVIVLDCPGMIANLSEGITVLIEDGIMSVKVIDLTPTHAVTEVIAGGTVKNHKGVNIPDADIPLPTMTPKDHDDVAFALSQDVDYVALSFVRTAQDIIDLRSHMKKLRHNGSIPKIIAKIERKEALINLDAILAAVDGVMVARGDLGIEADPTKVTLYQKDIIKRAMHHMRPVIVATQMLASMEHNPRPTRAEVSDVTNAVIDHTDAVMLSAETTVGTYPVQTIDTMAHIAHDTEISPYDDMDGETPIDRTSEEIIVAKGAYKFAREMDARAVIMYSESGYTARVLSHFRPERMLLVATNNQKTFHQLALVWGVIPFYFEGSDERRECIDAMIVQAVDQKLLHKDDLVVSVLGSTKTGKKLHLQGSRII